MEILMKRILVVLLMLLGLSIDGFGANYAPGGSTSYDAYDANALRRRANAARFKQRRQKRGRGTDAPTSAAQGDSLLAAPEVGRSTSAGPARAGAGDAQVEAEIRALEPALNRQRTTSPAPEAAARKLARVHSVFVCNGFDGDPFAATCRRFSEKKRSLKLNAAYWGSKTLEKRTDFLTKMLTKYTNLTKLGLADCVGASAVLADALKALPEGRNTHIKELDLSRTGRKTLDQMEAILKRCPNLTKLNLTYCYTASAALAGALGKLPEGTITDIQELDLSDMPGITAVDMRAIIERCPNLTKLNLSWCLGASGPLADALDALPEGTITDIQELDLSDMPGITANLMGAILTRCPHLRVLNLGHCLGASGLLIDALNALPEGTITHIQELDLSNIAVIGAISADWQAQIRALLPECRTFRF
jgi:hypothetical protein